MPYQEGSRLGREGASKLGHLQVLKSDFVQSLIERFEYPPAEDSDGVTPWVSFDPTKARALPTVIAVDGSLQAIMSDDLPRRELSFVKTALLRMDEHRIARIDRDMPHPIHMRDLAKDSAIYHSTVFPLKNVFVPDQTNYDLVRHIIRDSMQMDLDGQVYETLKWLAYQKWDGTHQRSPEFECPHCKDKDSKQSLPYDADETRCTVCGKVMFLTDMVGFHLEMSEDSAPISLASAYMLIHETLLLLLPVRLAWEQGWLQELSNNYLLIKDGPLMLRGQYVKLIDGIRNLLEWAASAGHPIHLMGQEKTGLFVDHLGTIARFASPQRRGDPPSYAILSHEFIRQHVQRAPDMRELYGRRTNYGEKVFLKLDPHHATVINVPTGPYLNAADRPRDAGDLIGLDRILATLPTFISHRFEGGLIPIELANGVASLSSYPSAEVLKMFARLR